MKYLIAIVILMATATIAYADDCRITITSSGPIECCVLDNGAQFCHPY